MRIHRDYTEFMRKRAARVIAGAFPTEADQYIWRPDPALGLDQNEIPRAHKRRITDENSALFGEEANDTWCLQWEGIEGDEWSGAPQPYKQYIDQFKLFADADSAAFPQNVESPESSGESNAAIPPRQSLSQEVRQSPRERRVVFNETANTQRTISSPSEESPSQPQPQQPSGFYGRQLQPNDQNYRRPAPMSSNIVHVHKPLY